MATGDGDVSDDLKAAQRNATKWTVDARTHSRALISLVAGHASMSGRRE
jgi:hypothetical protein